MLGRLRPQQTCDEPCAAPEGTAEDRDDPVYHDQPKEDHAGVGLYPVKERGRPEGPLSPDAEQ